MGRALVLVALAVAIAAPAALAADPVPTDYKNAAKYCKAVRDAKGVDAFQAAYGTNRNKKNAFGKCVSQTARAKGAKSTDGQKDNENSTDSNSAADCKKQQAADPAKFATDYRNLGQCVKAHHGTNKDDGDGDDQD
jgi:hypothetical protein